MSLLLSNSELGFERLKLLLLHSRGGGGLGGREVYILFLQKLYVDYLKHHIKNNQGNKFSPVEISSLLNTHNVFILLK